MMRGEGGRREWDIGITEAYRAVYTSAYKQMLPTQREQTKYVFFFCFFFFTDFPVIEEQVRKMKYPVMIFS